MSDWLSESELQELRIGGVDYPWTQALRLVRKLDAIERRVGELEGVIKDTLDRLDRAADSGHPGHLR